MPKRRDYFLDDDHLTESFRQTTLVNAMVGKWVGFPSSRAIRIRWGLNRAMKGNGCTAVDGLVGDDEGEESLEKEGTQSGCRGLGERRR